MIVPDRLELDRPCPLSVLYAEGFTLRWVNEWKESERMTMQEIIFRVHKRSDSAPVMLNRITNKESCRIGAAHKWPMQYSKTKPWFVIVRTQCESLEGGTSKYGNTHSKRHIEKLEPYK